MCVQIYTIEGEYLLDSVTLSFTLSIQPHQWHPFTCSQGFVLSRPWVVAITRDMNGMFSTNTCSICLWCIDCCHIVAHRECIWTTFWNVLEPWCEILLNLRTQWSLARTYLGWTLSSIHNSIPTCKSKKSDATSPSTRNWPFEWKDSVAHRSRRDSFVAC